MDVCDDSELGRLGVCMLRGVVVGRWGCVVLCVGVQVWGWWGWVLCVGSGYTESVWVRVLTCLRDSPSLGSLNLCGERAAVFPEEELIRGEIWWR